MCLLFDYDNVDKKKYSNFHHTEGFTHYESSSISLQSSETHPKNTHVNKPGCFGH